MRTYRIKPLGGGTGLKVDVADAAGGLRVVGIFLSETDAEAWIANDRRLTDRRGGDHSAEPSRA
jgi:hypothetical protein